MSVQITKVNNFIKIDCYNTNSKEFCEYLEEYDKSLLDKIYESILYYDKNCRTRDIPNKIIYYFSYNNCYYSIHSDDSRLFINKRTIYDKNNPHTIETFWDQNDNDISEFDKKFHIDDKTIIIDKIEDYYAIANIKHGLFHKSTFYGKSYNSKVKYFKRMLLNKNDLLLLAQQLIEDIKKIENIETLIDINIFEIIPKPDIKTLTKKVF